MLDMTKRLTILTALAHVCRKSLLLLEAFGAARATGLVQNDPVKGVLLRRRRNVAMLRTLLRAEGGERTYPPFPIPASVDADMVIAAEVDLLAYLERQLARADLPDDLHSLTSAYREDVLQAMLILQRLRDRTH